MYFDYFKRLIGAVAFRWYLGFEKRRRKYKKACDGCHVACLEWKSGSLSTAMSDRPMSPANPYLCVFLFLKLYISLSLSLYKHKHQQTYLSHFTFSLYLYICLPLSRFLSPRISLSFSLLSRCCIHLHALNSILAPFSISCNSSLIHLQYWYAS